MKSRGTKRDSKGKSLGRKKGRDPWVPVNREIPGKKKGRSTNAKLLAPHALQGKKVREEKLLERFAINQKSQTIKRGEHA